MAIRLFVVSCASVTERTLILASLSDQMLDDVVIRGEVVALNCTLGQEAAYRRVSRVIPLRAKAASQATNSLVPPSAIAVWEGKQHPLGALTSGFIQEAKSDGLLVIEVLTTRSVRQQ